MVFMFAFGGLPAGDQARAQEAAALPTLDVKPAFTALRVNRPLWIAEAPDDSKRLFLTEQAGQVLILPKDRAGTETTVFMDISDRKTYQQDEEGLLGFAFHPQFKANRKFYVFYTQQMPKRSVLSEFQVSATDPAKADLATERVLMEIPKPYWNHNGGAINFGPDGYLYVAIGDGGLGGDPHDMAQSLRFPYAKILRIDVNSQAGRVPYGIPQDNPFLGGNNEFRPETWAYGLRNAWRFSFDRQTGELWAGDVGQDKYEEVDLVVRGGNYGWSAREGFHPFKDIPVQRGHGGEGGTPPLDPIVEYAHNAVLAKDSKFPDHGIGSSIIGGYVYRGKKLPKLTGVYVYGDYVEGTIWGLRHEGGKLTADGTLVKRNPTRKILSFAEDRDGELYVLTLDGKISELVEAP